MIYGIGCDTEIIERFSDIDKKENLAKKIFTQKEREYIFSKKNFAQTAAGIFCAKESILKALGTGMSGYFFTDFEICHSSKGAPYVKVLKKDEILNKVKYFISISHSGEYATAFAVIETTEDTL